MREITKKFQLTDKVAKDLLKKAKSYELEEAVEGVPPEEVEDLTDIGVLSRELDWILECYDDLGTGHGLDLDEAKAIVRKTRGGRNRIIISGGTFRLEYDEGQIKWARELVNEVRRLKSLQGRIAKGRYPHYTWQVKEGR